MMLLRHYIFLGSFDTVIGPSGEAMSHGAKTYGEEQGKHPKSPFRSVILPRDITATNQHAAFERLLCSSLFVFLLVRWVPVRAPDSRYPNASQICAQLQNAAVLAVAVGRISLC